MNWDVHIKLLLPIFLRSAKRLRRLIGGLTRITRDDCDAAEMYRDIMIEESKRIGQKMVVEELLKNEFGSGITLSEGVDKEPKIVGIDEDNRVIVGGKFEGSAPILPIVIIPSIENTDFGYDVGVTIPNGMPIDKILTTVKRFCFPGVIVKKI